LLHSKPFTFAHLHHLVQLLQSQQQALNQVQPRSSLGQCVLSAPLHHSLPELQEVLQALLKAQCLGHTTDKGNLRPAAMHTFSQ
jgi:hypothetical protein